MGPGGILTQFSTHISLLSLIIENFHFVSLIISSLLYPLLYCKRFYLSCRSYSNLFACTINNLSILISYNHTTPCLLSFLIGSIYVYLSPITFSSTYSLHFSPRRKHLLSICRFFGSLIIISGLRQSEAMPSDASRFVSSLVKRRKKARLTAGTFVGEAGKDTVASVIREGTTETIGMVVEEKARQTAGMFVREAAKYATGKVADATERVGSSTGHAVVSATATIGTLFKNKGIPKKKGKVAVRKTNVEEALPNDLKTKPRIDDDSEKALPDDPKTKPHIDDDSEKAPPDDPKTKPHINDDSEKALPDDPKTKPHIDDDSEKMLSSQNLDFHTIDIVDAEDIGREGGSSREVTEDIDREGGSNREVTVDIDREGGSNQEVTEDIGRQGGSNRKVWIFLIANSGFEILSAAFDQLSSVRKPGYTIAAMLMAYVGLLGCIATLAFKGGKERVSWRWDREIPWFYISTTTTYRRFGTFSEIFGLGCAILQTISSTVAHVSYSKDADNPIKGTFSSVVFAIGLLCSQVLNDRSQKVG